MAKIDVAKHATSKPFLRILFTAKNGSIFGVTITLIIAIRRKLHTINLFQTSLSLLAHLASLNILSL